ncbi:MAG: hypothetical protein KDI16_04070 [Halioglobus sp.]|nr:hypothetical protein [Halioglobus sp.]
MAIVVLLLGVLLSAGSIYLLLRPDALRALLHRVFATRWLYGAALLRLLLGAALIAAAPAVAFPVAVAVLGWLFVLGALTLVVVPPRALRSTVDWFAQLPPRALRLWLGAALALGLFLACAALA